MHQGVHAQMTTANGRKLGFWMCTALVVGNMIGSGIFLLPASLAPYGLNSVIAWGFTAGGALVIALIFAALSRAFPNACGPYDYPRRAFGELAGFLKEGMECKLTFYQSAPLDIEIPTSVDLKVVKAEVAVRGDTATGVTKKVRVETGIDIQVPNFVKEGDTIRVDTRTGEYVTRV